MLTMGRGVQKRLSAGGIVLKIEALSLKNQPGRETQTGEELTATVAHKYMGFF